MYQRFSAVAVIALIMSGSTAFAQCGCSSAPVYAPVTSSYVSYYAPAAYTPAAYTSYYAPAAVNTSYYAAPVAYTSYYAPAAYTPAAYTTYYAPATAYATYYSPYVAAYAPVVAPYTAYYGVAGWSAFGAPRVYVPGEPVRNALKAITP